MSGAVQLVLQTDLASSRFLIPLLANDQSGAYLGNAKEVVRSTVTQRAGRVLLEATLTDNATQKNLQVINLEGASSSGVLPLLNELAKKLDSNALPFSTLNNQALHAYAKAVSTGNASDRIAALNEAISIDPSFGLAYIAAADLDAQAAPQQLPAIFQAASMHKDSFTILDRVRFNTLAARFSHAPLSQQEAAFRAVLQIAPNESDALVAAGSYSFLRGNAADGQQFLGRALQLNPGNFVIRRTLANGLFETKHFAEAEKVLVGMDGNPAILPELAICVLLEGDTARANTIAERLFASLQNPDAKILFRAVWLKLSGQSQKAMDLLSSANFTEPEIQAIAYSELALWQMMANDFASAKKSAARALQVDPRPESPGRIAAILAAANGPVDAWKQAVDSALLANNQQTKNLVLGYGLFLGRHYAEAAEVWRSLQQQAGDTDLRTRAMLAASLTAAGNVDQARQINVEPFAPDFTDLYATVSFLEMNRDLGIGVR